MRALAGSIRSNKLQANDSTQMLKLMHVHAQGKMEGCLLCSRGGMATMLATDTALSIRAVDHQVSRAGGGN